MVCLEYEQSSLTVFSFTSGAILPEAGAEQPQAFPLSSAGVQAVSAQLPPGRARHWHPARGLSRPAAAARWRGEGESRG